MQFGLYAPIPMATVGSPEIAQAHADALKPLPDGNRDMQLEHSIALIEAADLHAIARRIGFAPFARIENEAVDFREHGRRKLRAVDA